MQDLSVNNADISSNLFVGGTLDVSGATIVQDLSVNNADISSNLTVKGKTFLQDISGKDGSFNKIYLYNDLSYIDISNQNSIILTNKQTKELLSQNYSSNNLNDLTDIAVNFKLNIYRSIKQEMLKILN